MPTQQRQQQTPTPQPVKIPLIGEGSQRKKPKAWRYPQPETEEQAEKIPRKEVRQEAAFEEERVNPNNTSRIQKGKSSVLTPREILDRPEFSELAHELAAIVQFGTS